MSGPRLHTLGHVKHLLQRHYLGARYRHWLRLGRRQPLAWVTSGAPVELLRAMGVVCLYPENYAALVAAGTQATRLCEEAEAAGYSQDLCSYARISLGSVPRPDLSPMGGLPRPDLLLACNNICGTVIKWYQELAALLDAPLFVIDTPFLYEEDTTPVIPYVRAQLEELVAWTHGLTGLHLCPGRLRHTVKLAAQTTHLWQEIRNMGTNRPSPLQVADLFVAMAPVVTMRGTVAAVNFYRNLKKELARRIQRGVAAVPGERLRLLWDNIAIWYRLYRLFRPFADRGACFVADTYTGGWNIHLQEDDPMESLAHAYTTVFLNRDLNFRFREMLGLIARYNVQGAVFHCNLSCKPYSGIQLALADRIRGAAAIPVLVLEADMADPRAFAEETIRNRIEAFLEAALSS